MEFKAEEFVAGLLGEEALKSVSTSDDLEIPEWFDKEKFKRGQNFFLKYYFGFASSYIIGVEVSLAIPSVLKILIGAQRVCTPRNAYRRYWETFEHLFLWLHSDLKRGTKAWNSLLKIRKTHRVAMKASQLKGHGTISQRDCSITIAGTIAISYLRPEQFGIYQSSGGDWEAYNHFWAAIGYFIGLEDRYNVCLNSFEQTCDICRILVDRVFTPCLENPPEFYEDVMRTILDGISAFYPPVEKESVIFMCKNVLGVPGYITKESERLSLRKKIIELNGSSIDTGVKSTDLIEKSAISGLPEREPRILYLADYDSLDTSPAYNQLPVSAKYSLALGNIIMAFYSTFIGRVILNLFLTWMLFLGKYLPYAAIWRFGFKGIYSDDVIDISLKPNSYFYNPKA